MEIIDTHSHFNLHQFDVDREEAIARMYEAGVGTICIGIDRKTSDLAVKIAEAHSDIWACIGTHPTEWMKEWDLESMKSLAKNPKVVGVGECGLDYFREQERKAKPEQKILFKKQISVARELDLPLMLHIRPEPGHMDAYEEALNILQEEQLTWTNMRGTAHFFQGTTEIAQRFINLGFHISFSGIVTLFPEYQEIVKNVPLDRILIETDSPFAAPLSHRGRRNEPAYVVEIVEKIAEIKGISLEDVKKTILNNSKNLFNLR